MIQFSYQGIIETGAFMLVVFFIGFGIGVTQKVVHRVFGSESY